MNKKLSVVTIASLLTMFLSVGQPAFASANGTWTAYPGQSASYQTSVQQPINADGTSNFKSNGKAVIPVKFALSQGTGAFVFESIFSDIPANTANDYSYLSFTPNTTLYFGDITNLMANYSWLLGDCHGGSLRWTIRFQD